MKPERITILGSSGFIGTHLHSFAEQQGHVCVAPERDNHSFLDNELGHVIYCIGLTADFRTRPYDTVEAHVCLLNKILRQARFSSLLYLSSTRVYGTSANTNESSLIDVDVNNPDYLYNLSKLTGESLCFASGRNTRVARLSNVYGADSGADNFLSSVVADAVHKKRVLFKTAADSAKDYIGVEDVVRYLLRIALGGRDRLYNVASGVNVTHSELAHEISVLTDCHIVFGVDAPRQYFHTMDNARLVREFGPCRQSLINSLPAVVDRVRFTVGSKSP